MKHEKHRRILLFGIVLASLLIAAILLLEYIFGISGILARPVLRIGLEFAFLVTAFTPHQHALRTGRSLWDTSLWPDHLYGVGLLVYLAEIVLLVKLLWIDLRMY